MIDFGQTFNSMVQVATFTAGKVSVFLYKTLLNLWLQSKIKLDWQKGILVLEENSSLTMPTRFMHDSEPVACDKPQIVL